MASGRLFTLPMRSSLRGPALSTFRPSSFQTTRYYSVQAADKIAKFNGQKGSDGKYTVTLIEGDGIGPEISDSVKQIFSAANVPIKWEPVDVTPILKNGKTAIPDDAIASVKRNFVALKGPLAV
ncbi:hypothetical protein FQN49_005747 [Arthroderma sp. PD_2]|nr:hypothetical protein FQN49_005747 [Arthroderma sp. PD_2]